LEEGAAKSRELIQSNIQIAEKQKEELKSAIKKSMDTLGTIDGASDRISKEIETTFAQLTQLLSSRKQQLLADLKNAVSDKSQNLRSQNETMLGILNTLNGNITKVNSQLKCGDGELIQMQQSIEKLSLSAKEQCDNLPAVQSFDLTLAFKFDVDQMTISINQFGKVISAKEIKRSPYYPYDPIIECELCGEECASQSNLELHMKAKHKKR